MTLLTSAQHKGHKQLSNEQKGSTKSERKVFHWFDLQDKPTKSHAGVIHRGERATSGRLVRVRVLGK